MKQNPAETPEALKRWEGRSFQRWCAKDTSDERKIHYTLHKCGMEPETFRFTSEEDVDGLTMYRVQQSTVKSLRLDSNEWHVELQYL